MNRFLIKLKIPQYPIEELINNIILKVLTILKFGDKSKIEDKNQHVKNELLFVGNKLNGSKV